MFDEKMEDLGHLPNGFFLCRKPNEAGGYTYYSNEVGGGVIVWDTCLVAESTLLAALVCEHQRYYVEKLTDKQKQRYLEWTLQNLQEEPRSEEQKKDQVITGDVILLDNDECTILGDVQSGAYVVEDARDSGGWLVQARKLNLGKYDSDGQSIRFHQCPGYTNSLLSIKVIGHMQRIFV